MALPHHTKQQPINLKIFLSPEASAANQHQKRARAFHQMCRGVAHRIRKLRPLVSLPFHGWTCVPWLPAGGVEEAIACCSGLWAVAVPMRARAYVTHDDGRWATIITALPTITCIMPYMVGFWTKQSFIIIFLLSSLYFTIIAVQSDISYIAHLLCMYYVSMCVCMRQQGYGSKLVNGSEQIKMQHRPVDASDRIRSEAKRVSRMLAAALVTN